MPRDLPIGSVADRVLVLNARYRHHAATTVLEHALRDDDLGLSLIHISILRG